MFVTAETELREIIVHISRSRLIGNFILASAAIKEAYLHDFIRGIKVEK